MARHVDPDDTSFRRSLFKAAGGGLLALVVTFGATAVLTVVGRDAGTGPVILDDETTPPDPGPTDRPALSPTPSDPPTQRPIPDPTQEPTDDELGGITVQVLDAAGTGTHADDAAEVLRELGYDVVVVNDTPRRVEVTTILATPGHEDDAEGLRVRDPRFAEIDTNTDFNPDVDLHVLVGPDFS